MPQLHFSVSERTASAIRDRAEANGVPVSRLLAEEIEKAFGQDWPPGYFERVIGSWQGEFERPDLGAFEERDPL